MFQYLVGTVCDYHNKENLFCENGFYRINQYLTISKME